MAAPTEWPTPPDPLPTAVLVWGAANIGGSAGTAYLPPGFEATGMVSSGPLYSYELPRDGVLTNLHVETNSAAGNGLPVAYSVQLNSGAPSALTATLATGAAGSASSAPGVEVVGKKGDRIDLQASKPFAIGSGSLFAVVSVEFK